MPRNEVLERMVKKLKEYREGLAATVFSHKEYPSADDTILELLAIVEESTYDGTGIDGEEILVCEDDLVEAFQLAREAREEKCTDSAPIMHRHTNGIDTLF